MQNETTIAELTLRQIASCAAALPYADEVSDAYMERVFEKFRSFARRSIIEPHSENGQGKTAVYTEEMGCAGILLFELYEIGMEYGELRRLRQTLVPTRMKNAIAAIRQGRTVSFEVLHHSSRGSGEAGFGGLFIIDGQPDKAPADAAIESILRNGVVTRWRMVMDAEFLLRPMLKTAA